MTEEEKEKCEPQTRQITHCFDIVLEFSQCVLQLMFPAGQFLLGLQLEGRDGWDQGTTGTDRYIGSFGGPQPAVSGCHGFVCVCVCVYAYFECVCVFTCMYVFVCVCVCVCGVCLCVCMCLCV